MLDSLLPKIAEKSNLFRKLQHPEFLRSMERFRQSRVPREESFIGAVAAIEVDAPTLAFHRLGFGQRLERDPHLAGPHFGLLVYLDLRLEMAAPGEIAFGHGERKVQL